MKMKLEDTPSATPKTPSVVSHWCESIRSSEAPLCAITSGMYSPEHDVDEEEDREHRHRQADRAPRRLEQQHEPDGGDDDVLQVGLPGPSRELGVEEEEVAPPANAPAIARSQSYHGDATCATSA